MSRRSILSLLRDRQGASAVEFALVAPALFGLLFGVIEYGRLYWTIDVLQQTAIAGARCMGIRETNCAAGGVYSASNTTTYVQNVASQWGLTLPTGDINLNNNATCGNVTGLSQVQITYTFRSVVPALVRLSSSGNTVTTAACFPNNS